MVRQTQGEQYARHRYHGSTEGYRTGDIETMRVMVLIKATAESEAGIMPPRSCWRPWAGTTRSWWRRG